MALTLFLNILTSRSLTSIDQGKELLQIWRDLPPGYFPERFGNSEPLRFEFVPGDIEAALEHWEWPFLVKRRKPRTQGSIFMSQGATPIHGWVNISLDFNAAHQRSLIEFFKVVSSRFNAEFAFLQLASSNQRLAVTTHELRKAIPEFYWATILGKAYVGLFGRDRIMSAPVQIIEELSKDMYFMQISEEVLDMENRFEEVSAARRQIKTYLNANAFFDPNLGLNHVYAVPRFNFESSQASGCSTEDS